MGMTLNQIRAQVQREAKLARKAGAPKQTRAQEAKEVIRRSGGMNPRTR